MQCRKLLLGFSFYYLMVLSVFAIWLFASTIDLNTASNIRKSQAYGFLKVMDGQLLVAVLYALAGLFLAILLKRKSPQLDKPGFTLFYLIHFAVFILPSLGYLVIMLIER